MKPATMERALQQATDEQIASENARRNQAKRKVKTGGRNGGRPKKESEAMQGSSEDARTELQAEGSKQ